MKRYKDKSKYQLHASTPKNATQSRNSPVNENVPVFIVPKGSLKRGKILKFAAPKDASKSSSKNDKISESSSLNGSLPYHSKQIESLSGPIFSISNPFSTLPKVEQKSINIRKTKAYKKLYVQNYDSSKNEIKTDVKSNFKNPNLIKRKLQQPDPTFQSMIIKGIAIQPKEHETRKTKCSSEDEKLQKMQSLKNCLACQQILLAPTGSPCLMHTSMPEEKISPKLSDRESKGNFDQTQMLPRINYKKDIQIALKNYKRLTCLMCSSKNFDSDSIDSAYCENCLQEIDESKETNSYVSINSSQTQMLPNIKYKREIQNILKNYKRFTCVLCLSNYFDSNSTEYGYCNSCLQAINESKTHKKSSENYDQIYMLPYIKHQDETRDKLNYKCFTCAMCSSDYFDSNSADSGYCIKCLQAIDELKRKGIKNSHNSDQAEILPSIKHQEILDKFKNYQNSTCVMCSSDYLHSNSTDCKYFTKCLHTLNKSNKTNGKSCWDSHRVHMLPCTKDHKEIMDKFKNYKCFTCELCSSDYFGSNSTDSKYCIKCLQAIDDSNKTNGKSSWDSQQAHVLPCTKGEEKIQDKFRNFKHFTCELCSSDYFDSDSTDFKYCTKCLQKIDESEKVNSKSSSDSHQVHVIPCSKDQENIQDEFKKYEHFVCELCSSDYFGSNSTDSRYCTTCLQVIDESKKTNSKSSWNSHLVHMLPFTKDYEVIQDKLKSYKSSTCVMCSSDYLCSNSTDSKYCIKFLQTLYELNKFKSKCSWDCHEAHVLPCTKDQENVQDRCKHYKHFTCELCSSNYFGSDSTDSKYCSKCLHVIDNSNKTNSKSSWDSHQVHVLPCTKDERKNWDKLKNYKHLACEFCLSDYFGSNSTDSRYCTKCLRQIDESKKANSKSIWNSHQVQMLPCAKDQKEIQDNFKNYKCLTCKLCSSECFGSNSTDLRYCTKCLQGSLEPRRANSNCNVNSGQAQMLSSICHQKEIQNILLYKNFTCSVKHFDSDFSNSTNCKNCSPVVDESYDKCVDQPFDNHLGRDKTFVSNSSKLDEFLEINLAKKLHCCKISHDTANTEVSNDPIASYLQNQCNNFGSNHVGDLSSCICKLKLTKCFYYEQHFPENEELSNRQGKALDSEVTVNEKHEKCSVSEYSASSNILSLPREQNLALDGNFKCSKHSFLKEDILSSAKNCQISKKEEIEFDSVINDDKKMCCFCSPKVDMCDPSSNFSLPQNPSSVSLFANCLSTDKCHKKIPSARLMSNYTKIVNQYLRKSLAIAKEQQHTRNKKIDPHKILRQLKKNKSLMEAVDELAWKNVDPPSLSRISKPGKK
ncbi:uncharacterized protein TNCT_291681 [Trichonephila clavata]|uniref:Uncharacterized protein n=1 Tax=Trichonephila clavata TaxID=2740835 RepID=A0A8X6LC69_TRICU|nr:uncharacterized protein TNCT_291681 [Trichonephila clavata]